MASDDPVAVGPFILQNLLILAGAPFLAATVYMSLGRIARVLDAENHSIISIRWMTRIYVLLDFACIISQFIGSVLPASGDPAAIELSETIVLSGIITQFVALAFFFLQTWVVKHRIQKELPETLICDPSLRWKNHFRAIMAATVLLVVRSIVRATEYLQGQGGYIMSHEVFIYVFEASLMFLVMLVFIIIHPTRLVRDVSRLKESLGYLETKKKRRGCCR
jgi:hypothetical protein